MKSLFTSALVLLVTSAAFAGNGTGDIGSVGGIVPLSVQSTTNLIQQYSPQNSAMSIEDLCRVLAQNGLDWGQGSSKITCSQVRPGIIALTGTSAKGSMVVYANSTDMTVFEAFGETDIQQYQNNLGQILRVQLEQINSGTQQVQGGTLIQGHYRIDATMATGTSSLRVGAFSNL